MLRVVAEWRRFHGTNIVGQVKRAREADVWEVLVWAGDHPAAAKRHPHRFAVVTMAFSAADMLVRKKFQHECTVGTCGNWQIWTGTEQ